MAPALSGGDQTGSGPGRTGLLRTVWSLSNSVETASSSSSFSSSMLNLGCCSDDPVLIRSESPSPQVPEPSVSSRTGPLQQNQACAGPAGRADPL
ncbi:PREDICTED: uncharacterized protein LOC106904047 isoform X3 [Poecilia mexicana]|uniref:uncharacterized protein LOC106904047 isoform X3 n=1 Tax=Poecilia mexicana TaxID=48701 RepID=UPI00072E03BC|nr:PREDICTED: uncharacterized protein LOC106904047 isoform X3 [Poecilia mexicana]